MEALNIQENKIKCGQCGTEFDLSKNKGCPLCGFGREFYEGTKGQRVKGETKIIEISDEFLSIPQNMELMPGTVDKDNQAGVWGSWLMFNDFFSPKFLARVLAWKIKKENSEYIVLNSLIEDAVDIIEKYNLSRFKGFPNRIKEPKNLPKDNAVNRLVNHLLRTAVDMGLFKVEHVTDDGSYVWDKSWREIKITLTKDGLEFARLKNPVFDEGKTEQVLNPEEKEWLISYLKKIDKQGYKEYSTLKEVYEFLKAGNNGKQDLWNWFEDNERYTDYIKRTSIRGKNNPEVLKKQISNYARTFASAKISLLRELGVVRNKRNDYTIVGEL